MQANVLSVTVEDLAHDGRMARDLLALNAAHEVELSPLDLGQLRHLVTEAFVALRIGDVEAFLIALDQSATYDSPNFIWFRDRFDRFVYVDRIVVGPEARGKGHARRLYERLFELARQRGHSRVVCEVNSEPPNPQSDAFHRALDFTQVGAGPVPGRDKTVRYLMRPLPGGSRPPGA